MSGPSPRKKILIAPLDWGLGHATRCIPIIRELMAQDAEVFVAGDEKTREILTPEFPELNFLHLPGYKIKYSKTSALFPLYIAAQIPKILSAIIKLIQNQLFQNSSLWLRARK